MRLLLLLFILLPRVLTAEESPQNEEQEVVAHVDDNAVPSLVNFSFLPSALVNGCVNVISGDLCENETDDIVSGVDPYILGHNYCSSSLDEANLGDGWSFMHHQVLEVYMPCRMILASSRSINTNVVPWLLSLEDFEALPATDFDNDSSSDDTPDEIFTMQARGIESRRREKHPSRRKPSSSYPDKAPVFLSLYEPSGARLLFKARADRKYDNKYKLRSFHLVTKDYTNVVGGSISAHTNVKNTTVTYDSKDDAFTVTLGDGTKRTYERAKGYKPVHKKPHQAKYYRRYLLHKEIKPSGNRAIYEYNSSSEITRITTYNNDYSHKINEVLFDQKSTGSFAKHPSLHVRTSDNLEHIYRCEKLKGHFPHSTYGISRIESPGKSQTSFTYCEKSAQHKRRVIRKSRSDGYYIDTKYYRDGTNKVGGADVKVNSHFRKNRVRWQKGPLGPKGERINTYRYFYYKDKHGGGHTTVYDAYDNPTRYYYDKNRRIIRILRRNGYKQKLMSERFHWYSGSKEGFLKSHVIYDEQGKSKLARYFEYDAKGNVIKETVHGRITENNGSVRIRKGELHHDSSDKQVRTFTYSKDEFNLKTSECDPLGNYTFYEYVKGTNLLAAKFLCDKEKIRKREFFSYDKNASLIKHILDDGSTDDRKNLRNVTERHITKITPRTERPHFGEPEVIEEYAYDLAAHKKIFVKKTVNHFSKDGLVIKQELFDQSGAVVRHEYGYDSAHRRIWTKDPHGNTTSCSYDVHGRLAKKQGPRYDVLVRYEYDAAGRCIREIEEQTNGLTLTTHFEYDALGRKTAITTPQGQTTHFEYDALGRVITTTYPTMYDHEGKEIKPSKKFAYSRLGMNVLETDENDNKTEVSYNSLGKVTRRLFADGTEEYYEYDLAGNLVKETAPNGTETHYSRDFQGRVTEKKITKDKNELARKALSYNTFHLVSEKGPSGETTELQYDSLGRKVCETQSNKRTTTFAYDARGRLAEEKTWLEDDFIAKAYNYDDLDRVVFEKSYSKNSSLYSYVRYGYDAEGNQTETARSINGQEAQSQARYIPHGLAEWSIDAIGNKTLYQYFYLEENSHKQKVFRRDMTDARGCTHEERFDTRGNLSEVRFFDPFGALITYKKQFYDAANNLVRIHESVRVAGKEERVIVTTFSYGPNNRLQKIVEAAGTAEEKVTEYSYNAHGQKAAVSFSDNTTLHYTYDAKGRLERFFSDDGSVNYTYAYDNSDRVVAAHNSVTGNKTERKYNDFGDMVSETLESGLTLTYDYDKAGRVTELTLPDSSQAYYEYSPVYLQKIYRGDKQGEKRLVHEVLERDLSGYVMATDKGSFGHDKLGRCTKIAHEAFSQEVPQGGFDEIGNLLTLYTKDPQGKTERFFAYDPLSQLVDEKGTSHETYTYDSLYNRRTHNDKAYNSNALHAVLSDGKSTYAYDQRGNRLKKTTQNETTQYKYDALDRLIEVSGNGHQAHYTYDAFNRRVTKQTSTQTTHFLYSFDNEIGAVVDGAITELRVLGEGLGAEIGASVYMEFDGKGYTPLHDRQGSVTVLLDAAGAVAEHYRYDAFGNETCSTIQPKNPWRFSSKRTDEETGFVYFGRRYYDPSIGKWLTQDPLGLKAGPNLYAYVLNNPLTLVDQYGLIDSDTQHTSKAYHLCHGVDTDSGVDRRAENARRQEREEFRQYIADCQQEREEINNFYATHDLDVYTRTEPLNFDSEPCGTNKWGVFWNIAATTLEGCCLALDAFSVYLMIVPFAQAKMAGVGLKSGSLLLKEISLLSRLRATTFRGTQEKITSLFGQCCRSNKPTTDFIWATVEINGKSVQGWSSVGNTLKRIRQGIKHSHRNDGIIFRNDLRDLPFQKIGYYREYVIPTPGVNHAGMQRVITGTKGELFYSPDHYKTFIPLN